VDQYPSSGETVMWCNAVVRCNFNKLDVFPRLFHKPKFSPITSGKAEVLVPKHPSSVSEPLYDRKKEGKNLAGWAGHLCVQCEVGAKAKRQGPRKQQGARRPAKWTLTSTPQLPRNPIVLFMLPCPAALHFLALQLQPDSPCGRAMRPCPFQNDGRHRPSRSLAFHSIPSSSRRAVVQVHPAH
jgi:hypothetical protein